MRTLVITCPKCGDQDHALKWVPGTVGAPEFTGIREHIQAACVTCGYQSDHEPLDAEEKARVAARTAALRSHLEGRR